MSESEAQRASSKKTLPESTNYRDQLLAYRSDLQAIQGESQTGYDKTILTVCTGSLAATIGFFEKLPAATPQIGVVIAWGFWSFCLISTLLAYLGSVQSTTARIGLIDAHLAKFSNDRFDPKQTFWDVLINIGNWGSCILLFLGFVAFSASVSVGIMSEKSRKDERQTNKACTSKTSTSSRKADGRDIRTDEKCQHGTSDTTASTTPTATQEEVTVPAVNGGLQPSSAKTPHPPASAPAGPPSR